MQPYAFRNWWALQKPLKSAAPEKSTVPILPNPWGLSARPSRTINSDAAVDDWIEDIQASSPLILRLNKQAVTQHLGMRTPEALQSVSNLFLNTLMKTEDTLEGIASFYEKRRPQLEK